MQQKFFELIELENKKGATVFFSSHILNEVQRMCSRVAFIKEGRIIKLEKMSTLQENSYKRINVTGKSDIAKEYFKIGGVSDLEVKGNMANFIFKGNINHVMKKIADIELRNISIEEPDLEEIFMHYYAKED
jgi:ABC-2 type transport system ATP-binding protein